MMISYYFLYEKICFNIKLNTSQQVLSAFLVLMNPVLLKPDK